MIVRAETKKIAAFLFVLLAFGACNPLKPPDNILARVNGKNITLEEVYLKAGFYGIEIKSSEDVKRIVNGIINDRLVLKKAAKDKIKISRADLKKEMAEFVPGYSDDEIKEIMKKSGISYDVWLSDIHDRAVIRMMTEKVMARRIKITQEELKDYFWSNLLDFKTPDRVRARQIVVNDIKKAYEILRRLNNGEDFSELAKKYSVGSEAENGGDLGWFRKTDMPAFIANEAFRLKEGQVGRIMQSPYGYHILKCEQIQKAKVPKYEEVKDEVYEACYEEKKQEVYEYWIKELRQESAVEIFEENINRLFKEVLE